MLLGKEKKNISLIAAIDSEKILGFQLFEGGVKAKDFASFIVMLIRENKNLKENLRKYVFYFDNAMIHRAILQKPFFAMLNIFYAPSYSPALNPIELTFGLWKHYIRKLRETSHESLIKAVLKAFPYITTSHLKGFHKHCLEKSLCAFRGEDL